MEGVGGGGGDGAGVGVVEVEGGGVFVGGGEGVGVQEVLEEGVLLLELEDFGGGQGELGFVVERREGRGERREFVGEEGLVEGFVEGGLGFLGVFFRGVRGSFF